MPPRSQSTSKTISFRLPAQLAAVLEEAAELNGQSPGEAARSLVLSGLDALTKGEGVEQAQAEARASEAKIDELQEQVARLRSDVSRVLEMVLLNIGKADPEQVRQYVANHLRP